MDLLQSPPRAGYRGPENKPYHPHPDLIGAANAALVLGAPLLLTGEPGCGKTHFAWAAAYALGLPGPLQCYVRSDSRARDFLYHYDALRRFGDAQHGGDAGRLRAQDAQNYIELQALGQALVSPQRQVVLIDEVDKAPRDLPNDLLRELDQGRFEIPEIPQGSVLGELRRQMGGGQRPLLVITSNVERQLPDAFLRRCVFYHIPFPEPEQLRRIVVDHFQDEAHPGEPLIEAALGIFDVLREWRPRLQKRPATAELLGWVRVLLHADPDGQARALVQQMWRAVAGQKRPGSLAGLPGLGCLLKLREDLERVAGAKA